MDSAQALAKALELVALQAAHRKMTGDEMSTMIRQVHGEILAIADGVSAGSATPPGEEPGAEDELGEDVLDAVARRAQLVIPDIGAIESTADLVRRTVHEDHIVCLECGLKTTLLKAHLRRGHQLSGEEYRRRWGLPHDYSWIPATYRARRQEHAVRQKLGTVVRRPSKKKPPAS